MTESCVVGGTDENRYFQQLRFKVTDSIQGVHTKNNTLKTLEIKGLQIRALRSSPSSCFARFSPRFPRLRQ
jgi:hypothetical protein